MTHYADPTVLHAADCRTCGRTVRDADVLEDGECPSCVDDAPLFVAPRARTDWLALAADIVVQVRL